MNELKLTHLIEDNVGYYIRFTANEEKDFFAMVDRLKQCGRTHAQWKPSFQWPSQGKQSSKKGAWHVDADTMDRYSSHFSNSLEMLQKTRQGPRKGTNSSTGDIWDIFHDTRPAVPTNVQQAMRFLGFTATPTKDEVKKKFRTLALSCHPDVRGQEYEEKFKRLNNARTDLDRWIELVTAFGEQVPLWALPREWILAQSA